MLQKKQTNQKRKIIVISLIVSVVLFLVIFYLGSKNITNIATTDILNGNLQNNSYSLNKENNINKDNKYYQQVNEIFSLGEGWLLHNIKNDGSFVYLYSIDGGTNDNVKSSIIRQLLTFRVVAQLCSKGNTEMCQIHQRNLDYIFKDGIYQTVNKNGKQKGYLLYNEAAALGSNALTLRLLMVSPYFDQYQSQVKALLNGIKDVQKADGSFQPYIIAPKEFNYERKERFYSGETVLALMEYYRKTGDKNILNIAKEAEVYYLKKYVDNIQQNYYPAYVPWHTMALSKLWHTTNDQKYLKAIFKLNDKLLEMQDKWERVGTFYSIEHPEYGRVHSASDAIYSESLVTAYKIALEVGDKIRQEKYISAIKLSLDNLASLQLCNKKSVSNDIPKKLCGSFPVRKGSRFIRVDSLAHTMDFLTALKNILGIK